MQPSAIPLGTGNGFPPSKPIFWPLNCDGCSCVCSHVIFILSASLIFPLVTTYSRYSMSLYLMSTSEKRFNQFESSDFKTSWVFLMSVGDLPLRTHSSPAANEAPKATCTHQIWHVWANEAAPLCGPVLLLVGMTCVWNYLYCRVLKRIYIYIYDFTFAKIHHTAELLLVCTSKK